MGPPLTGPAKRRGRAIHRISAQATLYIYIARPRAHAPTRAPALRLTSAFLARVQVSSD